MIRLAIYLVQGAKRIGGMHLDWALQGRFECVSVNQEDSRQSQKDEETATIGNRGK